MFWDQAQNRMEWPNIVTDQGCPNDALPNWNIRVCYIIRVMLKNE
jgi:hypothetical protein